MATVTATRRQARAETRRAEKAERRTIGRGWMIATYVGLVFFLWLRRLPAQYQPTLA